MPYQASPELERFLAEGEAPVYIGFGSMFDEADSERVARLAIRALELAGKRGVLGGFKLGGGRLGAREPGEGALQLPGNVIAVHNVPHSWLFPRMSAVCHHGGAGTSAAGFIAGVPSIILPFALDQHAWAARAHELGVGAPPVPFKKLSAEALAQAIRHADQPEVRKAAAELGAKIATEQGARDCAQVIAQALH